MVDAQNHVRMESLLLQDYTTVRGFTSPVVQPSYGWLDLGDLEDIVLYCDVRETVPNATMIYETAPAPVDSAFVTLVPQFTLAVGLRTDKVFASFANVPVARYLRWRFAGGSGTWDATFRIWVAAYGWS
jgi:hypothetical protein